MKKLATLLSIALFSTASLAEPPWAEESAEESAQATQAEEFSETSPAMTDDTPLAPAAIEDASGEQSPIAEADQPAEAAPAETATETVVVTEQTGDVMQMPSASPAPVRLLDFPRRGMTTDKVENELGRPSEIIPAIGQPPISRWVYDDRIVYFEYSSVIHVVATK